MSFTPLNGSTGHNQINNLNSSTDFLSENLEMSNDPTKKEEIQVKLESDSSDILSYLQGNDNGYFNFWNLDNDPNRNQVLTPFPEWESNPQSQSPLQPMPWIVPSTPNTSLPNSIPIPPPLFDPSNPPTNANQGQMNSNYGVVSYHQESHFLQQGAGRNPTIGGNKSNDQTTEDLLQNLIKGDAKTLLRTYSLSQIACIKEVVVKGIKEGVAMEKYLKKLIRNEKNRRHLENKRTKERNNKKDIAIGSNLLSNFLALDRDQRSVMSKNLNDNEIEALRFSANKAGDKINSEKRRNIINLCYYEISRRNKVRKKESIKIELESLKKEVSFLIEKNRKLEKQNRQLKNVLENIVATEKIPEGLRNLLKNP